MCHNKLSLTLGNTEDYGAKFIINLSLLELLSLQSYIEQDL